MRLTVEIPDEEHMYLKMCCAKLNAKIKDFCGEAVIEKIEDWEDIWTIEKLQEEGRWDSNSNPEDGIPFEEVHKNLGL